MTKLRLRLMMNGAIFGCHRCGNAKVYWPYWLSSKGTSPVEALMKKVPKACTNKPVILVYKGPWCPEAFQTLGVEWIHKTFGDRNRIERWFRTMKARTRRFFNNFPVRKKPIFKIKLFIRLFVL